MMTISLMLSLFSVYDKLALFLWGILLGEFKDLYFNEFGMIKMFCKSTGKEIICNSRRDIRCGK